MPFAVPSDNFAAPRGLARVPDHKEPAVRALWIEDHQLIGDSLEVLFQVLMPDLSLDKARNIEEAARLAQTFQYQIVLLDWWIEGQDGERSLRILREAGCDTPFVVVSGDDSDTVMRRARELGAQAYVSKSTDPMTLVDAIRSALGDSTPTVPGALSKGQMPAGDGLAAIDVENAFPELTARQADVFRALMRGASDKQIARELGVSETTIKTHVRGILQAVGVRKRGEAVYQAMARGVNER